VFFKPTNDYSRKIRPVKNTYVWCLAVAAEETSLTAGMLYK